MAITLCNSYASLALSNLPRASITRRTDGNHKSIVNYRKKIYIYIYIICLGGMIVVCQVIHHVVIVLACSCCLIVEELIDYIHFWVS